MTLSVAMALLTFFDCDDEFSIFLTHELILALPYPPKIGGRYNPTLSNAAS